MIQKAGVRIQRKEVQISNLFPFLSKESIHEIYSYGQKGRRSTIDALSIRLLVKFLSMRSHKQLCLFLVSHIFTAPVKERFEEMIKTINDHELT